MSDAPTEYNELVESVEQNDSGVVAQVIQETHTPNQELEALLDKLNREAEAAEDRAVRMTYRAVISDIEAMLGADSH